MPPFCRSVVLSFWSSSTSTGQTDNPLTVSAFHAERTKAWVPKLMPKTEASSATRACQACKREKRGKSGQAGTHRQTMLSMHASPSETQVKRNSRIHQRNGRRRHAQRERASSLDERKNLWKKRNGSRDRQRSSVAKAERAFGRCMNHLAERGSGSVQAERRGPIACWPSVKSGQ